MRENQEKEGVIMQIILEVIFYILIGIVIGVASKLKFGSMSADDEDYFYVVFIIICWPLFLLGLLIYFLIRHVIYVLYKLIENYLGKKDEQIIDMREDLSDDSRAN